MVIVSVSEQSVGGATGPFMFNRVPPQGSRFVQVTLYVPVQDSRGQLTGSPEHKRDRYRVPPDTLPFND